MAETNCYGSVDMPSSLDALAANPDDSRQDVECA
jgi:hypothetical protein